MSAIVVVGERESSKYLGDRGVYIRFTYYTASFRGLKYATPGTNPPGQRIPVTLLNFIFYILFHIISMSIYPFCLFYCYTRNLV